MADTATEDFVAGRSYVFLQPGSVTAYMREEPSGPLQGGLVCQDFFVPAGTTFTVRDSHWLPPGADCIREVLVSVPSLTVPSENARGQKISEVSLSVSKVLLDRGEAVELKI
jgi:hypothetical protein